MTIISILGGTGHEGSGLGLRWAKAGHRVIIGSRTVEKAQTAANEINTQLGTDTVRGMDNESAARACDIAVLTVPPDAQLATLEGLKSALTGKILVDATARVDAKNPKPPQGKSSGRMAQELLGPEVRVAAAFQNVPAHALKKLDQELASDVLVCGDDPVARAEAIRLAESAGMKAFEAGGLDNGIVVEGLTAIVISLNKRYKSKSGGIRVSGINK